MSNVSETPVFVNASEDGEIPSFNGNDQVRFSRRRIELYFSSCLAAYATLFLISITQAKASDFANYFCSYAQLYHQKQMLADHNRMAAYHSAILGNQDVFRDKVVMDIGTGSGILAAWCAKAGAKKVYAIEYTDMAKHAEAVMKANNVDHIVTVIQGAVETIELPIEKDGLEVEVEGTTLAVDIIVSEWMGYFLLRESMLDSVIRARDKFLKKKTGLMFPSHTTMYVAPVCDEQDRKANQNEHSGAMADWNDFTQTTSQVYGVDMDVLTKHYEREQKEYYLLSSRWRELHSDDLLAEPAMVKHLDMITCTIQDAKGLFASEENAKFDFEVHGDQNHGPISGLAGWFTADFQSRTDAAGVDAPKLQHPAFLSTGPEDGYTHWGQQVFYFLASYPLLKGETTRIQGQLEMTRTKENTRLYNCRITYNISRRRSDEKQDGDVLMKSAQIEQVYQIP
jgi:protein arginine N-methyltransferase 1